MSQDSGGVDCNGVGLKQQCCRNCLSDTVSGAGGEGCGDTCLGLAVVLGRQRGWEAVVKALEGMWEVNQSRVPCDMGDWQLFLKI